MSWLLLPLVLAFMGGICLDCIDTYTPQDGDQ